MSSPELWDNATQEKICLRGIEDVTYLSPNSAFSHVKTDFLYLTEASGLQSPSFR